MKKIIISVLAIILMVSCNDDFLEKYPKTDLNEKNAFLSYDTYRYFMYPCYDMFQNTNILTSVKDNGTSSVYRGDVWAGYLGKKNSQNQYASQSVSKSSSGNGWNFSYIRRVNLMLSHVDEGILDEIEAKHWRAVGYFFHSFWYMELIARFGDVPWVDKVLNDASPEAYDGRMPRKEVADKVLERLIWAEENIGDSKRDGDGKNSQAINQNTIRAAISRFTLREGTWRKYHGLGDYDKYFTACAKYSELLMADYPNLYMGTDKNNQGQPVPGTGYGEMWTTRDLANVPGVIFFKRFVGELNGHRFSDYEHIASHDVEMPQYTVDMYLCQDGKTISNSSVYEFGASDRM